MIFSKIKLFGLLALSYSLIACGQTPVSTAPNASPNATPNATPTAIAQTTVAPQPTESPVAVAKSPEPQPSVTQVAEKSPEPQPSVTANGHSLINSSFSRELKSLGIKIALPQYVPEGFWAAAVRTEPCRQGDNVDANGVCRFRPEYTVIYRNPQNHCFVVDAIGGGIGGPSGRYTRAVSTQLLGKVDVNIDRGMGEPMTEAIANTPQENVWSFPAGKSPFYSVRTIDSKAANRINAAIICSDTAYMTPNEFTKIVQSLEWLP
jgi:hypothetical protein